MNNRILLIIVLALIVGAVLLLQKPLPGAVQRVMPSAQHGCNTTIPPRQGILAPELVGIAGYVNTNAITLSEFVGKKVVLVDFWTYSCINCQRTLPYLVAWDKKYRDQGLQIIGVHSPEFEFEKKLENVQRAVEKWGIQYPVVLDNEHATWNAFNNNYWPAKYLIDVDGHIVWTHFGEGNYDEAEQKIQELLTERAARLCLNESMNTTPSTVVAQSVDFYQIGTPEIYLGASFTRGNFGNKEGLPEGKEVTYALPSSLRKNEVYLDGLWFVDADNVRLASETGKAVLEYTAKNVHIVASAEPGSDVTVLVDGKQMSAVRVGAEDLYTVVHGTDYNQHTLELNVHNPGFRLYTFTFG